MSSVLPAPASAGFAPREGLGRAFAGFSRRHLLLILCFGVLTPLIEILFMFAYNEPVHPLPFIGGIAKYLVIGCSSVCFAIAGDNLLRQRVGPAGSLAIAFFAASIVSVALMELIMYAVIAPLGWDATYKMESKGITTPMRILVEFVGAARWALVLLALYELLESNQRAGEELHAARMTAVAAQQNLVEGELRAMQARVDPELLFNSLVSTDEGYAHGVEAGQQRLDSLIRFLRAALPSDFGGTSTVAREQELVEAYVALLNQRGGDPVQLQVRVDPGAGSEQMPSMLLLPLVRWALATPSARNVRTRIGRRGEMLAIEVDSDARKDEAAPAGEIISVRDRIAQLYAESAQLAIESGRARLEIPRPTPAVSQA
jgi:hypothetical protein